MTNTKHFYSIKNKDMKVVVREKKYIKHEVNYLIYNCDPNYICYNDYNSRLFRSVVFSEPENKIISFSPPKSLSYESFRNHYPELNENIVINDYIEGIMFHLFYDKRIHCWELSYKKSISYNENFRRILINILSGGVNTRLNDIHFLSYLPKNASYNLILSHDNIYLISVYYIHDTQENNVQFIPNYVYKEWDIFKDKNCIIQFPVQYYFTSYENLYDNINAIKCTLCSKLVLTNNETGDISSLSSNEYIQQSLTCNIEPNVEYLYICLERVSQTHNYLNNFSHFRRHFSKIKNKYEEFINSIYKYYIQYYILKNHYIPYFYLSHIHKIHSTIYIPNIKTNKTNKTNKTKITKKSIKDFFHQIHPRELLFLLQQWIK